MHNHKISMNSIMCINAKFIMFTYAKIPTIDKILTEQYYKIIIIIVKDK